MSKNAVIINYYEMNAFILCGKIDNFNNFYESIIKIIKMSIYSGFATRQQ